MPLSNKLVPHLSPDRRAWLKRLAKVGPARRPSRSPVGYHCMALGWTEWDWRDPETGEPITVAQAQYLAKTGGAPANPGDLERITATGRAALRGAK